MKYIYYELLSFEEKNIYSAIVNGLNAYKFSFCFKNVTKESVINAYIAVFNDRPEFFWLTNGYSLKINKTNLNSEIIITPHVTENNPNIISKKLANINDIAAKILKAAEKYTSNYEKILFVHVFLVDWCKYIVIDDDSYNAYGSLINRKSVCSGYASAFQLLLQKFLFL